MILRTRLIITALLLCHLLVATPLVTSQLQPAKPAPKASAASRFNMQVGDELVVKADQQEMIGNVFHLKGDVEVTFRNMVVKAADVTYDRDTGDLVATGNVEFSGGPHDEHITATHGTYNINTDNGRFYDVVGTTGARFKGRTVVLTSSEPFAFTGKVVDKVGRDKLIIHHGTATTCRLPRPKWTFNAAKLNVVAGEDARIYESTFRLYGIPVFFFPYATHPVEHLGRHSGFLMPNIGHSSVKGTILGDSFFWAIDRSADATLGAEYFSNRGWAEHVDFHARPTASSFINATYFGVVDRGIVVPAGTPGSSVPSVPSARVPPGFAVQDQGGEDLRVTAQGIFHGLRAVADIDYLSNFLFRLAFAETFTQAINSEVRSTAFISDNVNGFSFGTALARYQNFQSATPGDVITIVHAPSFESSSTDHEIGKTPLYWSYDAAVDGVSRREPSFVTAPVVGRIDLTPQVTMPLHWKSWSLRPQIGVEETWYSDRLGPSSGIGIPEPNAINRRALESEVELRPPALEKLFLKPVLGRNLKHTFEPRIVYRNVHGVNNFNQIVRFDARDILSDTNEVEYGFINRLYAKRVPKGASTCVDDPEHTYLKTQTKEAREGCEASPAREVVTWEIAQKYFMDPNFGGALVNGRRNVFTTTAEFTGIAFVTEPRQFSPVISRLRARATATTDAEWQLDYDTRKGRISSSMVLLTYHFLKDFSLGGAHIFLRSPGEILTSTSIVPQQEFNQYRLSLQYGRPNRTGFNAAGTVGYDVNLGLQQYSAYQMTYNWECCGVTAEYRRFALGSVRNENQFRFALTLANVGTFGTLRKQERLF
jgi:LPS-assembly protein